MGGVCAVIDLAGHPIGSDVIGAMMAAAAHRGRDGARSWHGGGAALGELALNVWPRGERTTPELDRGDLVLAADARVDNRDELRAALRASGALPPHDAPSDADLILGAYRAWGRDAPARILGDFVFVIWDRQRRILFAARDTGGSRPLYVCRHGSRVYVASEVKQILAVRPGPTRINEAMLGAYLVISAGRPEWTFYDGVEHIPAAHALQAGDGQYRIRRYWDVDPNVSIRHAHEDDYAVHLRDLLGEVMRARIAVDRPMGVWLSGGLDSCSIASVLGSLLDEGAPGSGHAFSFAFEEFPDSDERHVSRHIVDRYGFASSDIPADDAWPLRDSPLHGPDQDEPLMGAYQVLHDRLYDAAVASGVGVTFTGASGDNVAGSGVFDYLAELRHRPVTAWRHLRAHATTTGQSLAHTAARRLAWPVVATIMPTRLERRMLRLYARRRDGPPVPPWIRRSFADRIGLEEILEWRAPAPPFPSRARENRYRSVTDGLTCRAAVWNERNHAKRGLVYVDPWNDRRLAEFAVAVPQWLFNRGGERKALVRRAMRGVMPEEARRLAGKIYPDPLYQRGIQQCERAKVAELLGSSRLAEMGVIDAAQLLEMIRADATKGSEWPVLSTELWLERYWS